MTKHTIQSLLDKKQETANTSTILSELFAINPKTGKQAGDMRDLLQRLSYDRAQQNSKPEHVIKKSTNRKCKTEKVNRKWRAKDIMRSTRFKACFL
jgi:hypothetical protein